MSVRALDDLDPLVVKRKTTDLVFVLRTLVGQIGGLDQSPEGRKAREIVEDSLSQAIPDGRPSTPLKTTLKPVEAA